MIREAIVSDVPRIRSLMQAIPGFWQPWWSDETIATAIRLTNTSAFVWEDDDSEILGYVCAHDLGFRAYLSELAVVNHARHRGIGTLLVRKIEEALRKRNQRVVIADVWHDAESFYRSLGWETPKVILLRQRLDPQD
jgi:ribosomal protein S18 acetylase RimI-like enzyme